MQRLNSVLNKLIGAALTVAGVASVASTGFYVGMSVMTTIFSLSSLPQLLKKSSNLYVVTVPAGHKAVVFDRISGVLPVSKDEGLNFKIPLIQVCRSLAPCLCLFCLLTID
jgi:hypothetical protein